MKKISLKLLVAIIAFSFAFAGCSDDDVDDLKPEDQPNDETIVIDDNSAFNMKNFITSFEQLFMSYERWAIDFDHVYDDGNAITTYQNYKIYGKFGNKMFTLTHAYDNNGVITSSVRPPSMFESGTITFTYEYDLNGFIVKMTKWKDSEARDIVNLVYNDQEQLISKIHKNDEVIEEIETFTYNATGQVDSYTNQWRDKYEYEYFEGNMVKETGYDDGVIDDIEIYEYNSDGNLIKIYEEGSENTDYQTLVYTDDILTNSYYYDGLLDYVMEMGSDMDQLKEYSYRYDGGVFDYCKAKEYDTNGNTSKKYYYEGTAENLELVGYTVIDSRDALKDDKKTKESVYNESDKKLYYAEFIIAGSDDDWWVDETNWFNASGTSITEQDITEDWVLLLVR
ncbi:MAG: hypothetical protein GQ564_03295 [Bacteroidales bacterium]|nr:hypothetical protein [Bacteroidales bacterium]